MGEKPEVLEAVLKEAVDLVTDLSILKPFWCLAVCFGCLILILFNCRKIYPLMRFLKI